MTTQIAIVGHYPIGDRRWLPPEWDAPFRRVWDSADFGYESVDIDEMMQSLVLGNLPQVLISPLNVRLPLRILEAIGSSSWRRESIVSRQDVVALKRDLQTSQNLNDQLLDAVERLATILSAVQRTPSKQRTSIGSSAILPSDGAKRRSANRWRLPGFSIPPTCELSGWASKPSPGSWRSWRSVAASGTSRCSRLPGRILWRRKIVVSGPRCGQPGTSGRGSTGGSIDRCPASV